MKKSLIYFLNDSTSEFKPLLKKAYNLLNDVRVFSTNDIIVSKLEFKKLFKIAMKIKNNQDITFDIGYKYFRGNKLKIKKGVFVPQYDTEQIIDLAKEKITNGTFLEIGTGSGAIPISLVNETNMIGVSIDTNKKATKLAKENFHGDKNKLLFINNDFKNFILDKVDLIISNPPYIKYDDINVEDWVRENQPKEALYASNNGLDFFQTIFDRAPILLKNDGYIILEIGYDQGENVKNMAKSISKNIELIKDYNNNDRFIVVKYNYYE